MTRLFFDYLVKDTRITLNSDDSHYISSVLRMHPGEGLTIVDSSGEEILAKIDFFDNKSVTLSVCSRRKCTSEPTNQVTLYQSISKGERMDLTIQKSVELGVARIVPVLSNRCVVKIDSKSASSKVDRWQKIALEAARQSGRGIVPEIAMPILVGVQGGQPGRAGGAEAPDDDRRRRALDGLGQRRRVGERVVIAGKGEGRALWGGPQALDDLELLFEQVEALAEAGVGDAVGLVLAVVPAGAEAQLDPSAAHGVDRGHADGEGAGQPEGHRGDEGAEPDAVGVTGEAGERGPRVGRPGAGVRRRDLQVVVGPEEGVEARLLGDVRHREELVVGGALLGLGEDPQLHGRRGY